MKKLNAFVVLFAAALPAYPFDYNVGMVPCVGCMASGSVPAGWAWGSTPGSIMTSSFSDTMTFYLGDWAEPATYYPPDGASYNYTSSHQVVVFGVNGGSRYSRSTTAITGSTLDGVPMSQSGSTWYYNGSLAPGSHTIAVTGNASSTQYGHTTPGGRLCYWNADVNSILYTLVYNPPD